MCSFLNDRRRMLPQDLARDRAVVDRPSLRRSVDLFRAFRVEQTDPDRFYGALASDSISQLRRLVDPGRSDRPGHRRWPRVLRRRVRRSRSPVRRSRAGRGRAERPRRRRRATWSAAPGSSSRSPTDCVDLAFSSNVLEHVPDPRRMADEMLRVTRPGGVVFLSWTPWLSPWGGHETSPWHYLGGQRAADRYARQHGHRPKNDFGRSLFNCSVGRMVRWAHDVERDRACRGLDVVPRYHPWWAQWVMRVPGLREVVSWNAVIVLRAGERRRRARRCRRGRRPGGPRLGRASVLVASSLVAPGLPQRGRVDRGRHQARPGTSTRLGFLARASAPVGPPAAAGSCRTRRTATCSRWGRSSLSAQLASRLGGPAAVVVPAAGPRVGTLLSWRRALGIGTRLAGDRARCLRARPSHAGGRQPSAEIWPMAVAPWVLLPLVPPGTRTWRRRCGPVGAVLCSAP